MPLSEEEKKERRRIRYKNNREKMLKQSKEWNEANKEKIKEYLKEYRLANKEKRKEYRLTNKDKLKEQTKEYNQSVGGKKANIISGWKTKHKILFKDKEEAEFYYETYINTHNCSWCDIKFINSKDRCFDHCHTCGVPRAIICRSCNVKDLVPCSMCLLQN